MKSALNWSMNRPNAACDKDDGQGFDVENQAMRMALVYWG